MRRVAAAAGLAALATPAEATGGSFTLCYERLKQFAALYAAQGSPNAAIVEPVDAPEERRYVLEMRIGEKIHRFTCTRGGRIERVDEE